MSLRFSSWQQLIVTQSALENQSGTSQLVCAIALKLYDLHPCINIFIEFTYEAENNKRRSNCLGLSRF